MCVTKRAWHQPKGHVPILVGTLDLCQPCLCPPPGPVRTGNGLCHTGKRSACKLTTGRGGGGGGRLQRDGRGPPPPIHQHAIQPGCAGRQGGQPGWSKTAAPPPVLSTHPQAPLGSTAPPARNCAGGGEVHKNITSSSLSPSPAAGGWLGAVGTCRIRPRCSCREYIQLGRFCLEGWLPKTLDRHGGSPARDPHQDPLDTVVGVPKT